jgi:hypothetical protein
MANQNGNIYGLTILSPIIQGDSKDLTHATAIRWYLARQPRDRRSPLGKVTGTHQARLVVMDDVVYVGAPACEEHLQSRYLVFETNFDGDLDAYLMRMATEAREFVHSVWQHCVGYPGVDDPHAFAAYMKKCQVNTTFYFADVNNNRRAEFAGAAASIRAGPVYRTASGRRAGGSAKSLRRVSRDHAQHACARARRRRFPPHPAGEPAA